MYTENQTSQFKALNNKISQCDKLTNKMRELTAQGTSDTNLDQVKNLFSRINKLKDSISLY